jgi:CRP-like cAMP-binding protein
MANEQTLWAITLFGLMISAIYMMVSLRIRSEYTNSLMTLLTEDETTIFRWGDEGLDQAEPATIKLLNERLEASTDDDLTIFLAEMLIDIQGSAALDKLEMLAIHRSPKVQAALLDKMASFWNEKVRHFSQAALIHEHPDVRYAAVKALTHAPNVGQDKSLQDIFRARLNDPDERVQAAVIVPLMASGDFYYLAPAVERLSGWLDPRREVHYRKMGLQLLAKHSNHHLLPSLVGYLNDPDAQIRRQTVKLVHQIATRTEIKSVRLSALNKLRAALSDEDESVRLAVVKALEEFTGSDVNQALFIALKDPSFMVRSQASAAMTAVPELEEMLDAENRYLAESAAYILASRPGVKRRLLELIEELVHDAYMLQGQRLLIESLEIPAVKLLNQTMNEELEQLMRRAFWLLAGLSDKEKAETIQQALRSEKPLTRANAAETLESLASPRLSHLMAPLFDQRPLAEVVQIGQKMLGLPRQNMQQFLCQAWPQLCGGEQQAPPFNLRPLYEEGWLTATVIYMLWQMRQRVLNEGTPKLLLLNNKVLLYALKATLHHSASALVQETATLVWYGLGDAILENPLQENKMLTKIEKIIFLKQVSFFKKMELKHLRVLADISEEVSYEAKEQIVAEGEDGDALYVVVSGRVAMQREATRRGTPAIIRLTTLRPYDYFAEMSIFDNKAHDADAVALEDTTLLLVRQRPLMALIDHQPQLSVSLLKVLSQRLRRANDLIASKSPSKPKLMVDLYDKGAIHQLGAFENRLLLQ